MSSDAQHRHDPARDFINHRAATLFDANATAPPPAHQGCCLDVDDYVAGDCDLTSFATGP
ncbi:MAG: hypothetical protein AB7T06_18590 [Kofleriaceae bacterium]